jgi:hypothetical protein
VGFFAGLQVIFASQADATFASPIAAAVALIALIISLTTNVILDIIGSLIGKFNRQLMQC